VRSGPIPRDLSQFPSHATFQGTQQTSRGKTYNLQYVSAGFTMHAQNANGGLSGHVPTGPERTSPYIRFLFVAPYLWIRLPPDLASRRRPCHLLSFGFAYTWSGDFHPASYMSCPAHTRASAAALAALVACARLRLATKRPGCRCVARRQPVFILVLRRCRFRDACLFAVRAVTAIQSYVSLSVRLLVPSACVLCIVLRSSQICDAGD
jgi:hypothetical protein